MELDQEVVQEIKELAENVRVTMKLSYDLESVQYLEGFIERTKAHIKSKDESGVGFVDSIASFFGECIIANYGGRWTVDDTTGNYAIEFDDKSKVFPASKVQKQFDNGLEDSISSMFTMIPIIFKNIKQKQTVKKSRWKFW